jgi:hypothetical protein
MGIINKLENIALTVEQDLGLASKTPNVDKLPEDVKAAILVATGVTSKADSTFGYQSDANAEKQQVEKFLTGTEKKDGGWTLARDLNTALINVDEPAKVPGAHQTSAEIRAAAVTIAGAAGGTAFDAANAANKDIQAVQAKDPMGADSLHLPKDYAALANYTAVIEAAIKQDAVEVSAPSKPLSPPTGQSQIQKGI